MDIKKVIKEKGWTLEKLAAEMKNRNGEKGITQSSVSQMLNGNPTLDKLVEIADILGISVSELLSDEYVVKCPKCGAKLEIEIKEV